MRMVRETANHAARNEAAGAESYQRTAPILRLPQADELDALLCWVTHAGASDEPGSARRFFDLLRDPGIREIYGTALESLRPGTADVASHGSTVGRRTFANK